MLTYYTVIGKNLDLIKEHLENVLVYAGLEQVKEKEVVVVQYHNESTAKVEDEITAFLETVARVVHQKENKPSFLHNLYDSWNLGYEHAQDGWVFRGGSDQVFSENSFLKLEDLAKRVEGEKIVLQANTIENAEALAKIGCTSRHLTASLGNNFKEFDFEKFGDICEYLKNVPDLLTWQESFDKWRRPLAFQSSFGIINREDGFSWLMKRSDWVKYGPLVPIENGVTGDVLIHDKMQRDGYEQLIMRDVITYHFVRGESFDQY
jgi:hypothetical protein